MRTRRSILNFGSGVVFAATTAITSLVTKPWLVGWLGEDRLGAFRMITDLYGFLTLVGIGLAGGLPPLLARSLNAGDEAGVRGAIATGMRVYSRVTLVTIGLGLAMGLALPWLVPVPISQRDDVRLAWTIGLLNFAPMCLGPFQSLAEARQRGYLVNLLMVVQVLLITALTLGFAALGWWAGGRWSGSGEAGRLFGVSGQALAYTLGIWFFFAMLARDGLRKHPGMLRSALRTPADRAIAASLWSLSLPSLMITLSGRVGLLSDSLIAGGLLGPALVIPLLFTIQLVSLAQAQLQMVGAASWAGLAEIHNRGEIEVFRTRLVELTTLVMVLGFAALGPIVAYNRDFFGLWVGRKGVAYAGDLVAVVAAANAMMLGLFSLWGWCFTGTGRVRRMVGPSVAASAVNLAASLALTWRFGLVGPMAGTLAANLLVSSWWLPMLLHADFGVSRRALAGAIVRPTAWGLPFSVGLWMLARAYPPGGWLALLAIMGLASAGFLALGGLAILGPAERALWRVRLAAFWPRRSPASAADGARP